MRKLYPHKRTTDVAKALGRSVTQVYNRAHFLNLSKTAEFLQSELSGCILKGQRRGMATEFKKGQVSYNKGKKQKEYMSAAAIRRTKKTRFKNGHLPHNTKSDGAITIRTDRRGVKEQFMRVRLAEWVPLRRQVWEQHNGPIPTGGVVRFKDGNTFNCDISNLELVTRAENMTKNTIHRYPPEIKQTIRLVSKLNKTINKKTQHHG